MRVDARAVAVTGYAVVAPCGTGRDAFWDGLLATPKDEAVRRVVGFDPSPWFTPKGARRLDPYSQFAVACSHLALEHAGPPDADPERSGVVLGTGIGGVTTLEEQILLVNERGPGRVSPFTITMAMPNAAAAAVSLTHGWRGPCETVTTACAAGTHAIAAGARLVADGRCDAVLAGGSETAMTATTLAAFAKMTALTETGISRPFDRRRDGFAASEGAAVLLLEPLERARARGATVHGIVAGAASTTDAHHLTVPAPGGSGAAACMRLALADAGLGPGDVTHVNAHGTSTPLNDVAEAEALRTVFGASPPPVTSVKGVTGHALGAAGALEAAAVLLSFAHGTIPPTAGYAEPDPAVDLDVVDRPRPFTPGPVLSNSFGFGGHNGTLVLLPPPA